MGDPLEADEVAPGRTREPDAHLVATGAAAILAAADRALDELRAKAEQAAEDAYAEMKGELREDRVRLAAIDRDLKALHVELAPIKSGIAGLQTNSLRETGAAALVLAVLIAVAWKVIGG